MTTWARADAGAWFNYTFLTQKERDIETGLDHFGARYYASAHGGFTSVDPLMASGRANLPQSWNRYTYVLNNPINLHDPDGMLDNDPNKPRIVVVVFGGGHPLVSSSKGGGATDTFEKLRSGGKTDGIGETSISDWEQKNIAQKIANDFPNVEVFLAGPDAIRQVGDELMNNKPDHIILEGFSRGADKALNLANILSANGQIVDQLTTVDPECFCRGISGRSINDTTAVKDALNLMEFPGSNTIEGAQNVIVGENQRQSSSTPYGHTTIDDITSPAVVNRIGNKINELNDLHLRGQQGH